MRKMNKGTYIRSMITRLQNNGIKDAYVVLKLQDKIRSISVNKLHYFKEHIEVETGGIWKLNSKFDYGKLIQE